jgi:hypothetical protein
VVSVCAEAKNDKGRRGDLVVAAARGSAAGGADRPPAVRQLRALLLNRIRAIVAGHGQLL